MRFVPLLLAAGCATSAFTPGAFERHVSFLASDDFKGRNNGTPEGMRAAQYVADRFREAGLHAAGTDGTWFHDFNATWSRGGTTRIPGRNVAGLVRGTDLREEMIVVGAHHDGLGEGQGKIFNGADDNASGVAMILELAASFARRPARRTVLFVSFDAEENGMIGSREFVRSGLHDVKAVSAMFCFDLIGGSFTPADGARAFALGAESSATLSQRVDRLAGRTWDGLEVRPLGIYLIEMLGPRSDYAAYRDARVPYVFLSTGTPWYYHTVHDDAGLLDYGKMARIAGFSEALIRETADDPSRPGFIARPRPDIRRDVSTLAASAATLLEQKGVRISDHHRSELAGLVQDLKAILESPEVPEDYRRQMTRIMTQYFGIVRAMRPE